VTYRRLRGPQGVVVIIKTRLHTRMDELVREEAFREMRAPVSKFLPPGTPRSPTHQAALADD